jgi:hypothetical protein
MFTFFSCIVRNSDVYCIHKSEARYAMEWITVKEAGQLWSMTTRRAQVLCANGKVDGAQKLGNIWVIPKGAPKPIDGRTKASKAKRQLSDTTEADNLLKSQP